MRLPIDEMIMRSVHICLSVEKGLEATQPIFRYPTSLSGFSCSA